MCVRDLVAEPLVVHGIGDSRERAARVSAALERVGLAPDHADRWPHEFSGGQRQRIGIARALVLEPRFVFCGEPVSALDVSVQSQILILLRDLQASLGLTYMFVSHHLAVVRQVADRVALMYLGRVVELAAEDTLFARPKHPYAKGVARVGAGSRAEAGDDSADGGDSESVGSADGVSVSSAVSVGGCRVQGGVAGALDS